MFDSNPSITFVERGRYRGEEVYAAWGQSKAGRYLIVSFIHKLTGEALVLSAREMDAKGGRRYAKTHRST